MMLQEQLKITTQFVTVQSSSVVPLKILDFHCRPSVTLTYTLCTCVGLIFANRRPHIDVSSSKSNH